MFKPIILKSLLMLLIGCIFIYLPIFIRPDLLLNRGNDLTEFFWPIIYYTKESLTFHHQLPLWNNLFFAGTPLVTDPQSMIFYLPNAIFLILPMDTAFLVSMFTHTFFGGIGIYLTSKQIFKFKNTTAIILSFFYISSVRLFGYLEAGHFGLVLSHAWLAWVAYSTLKLIKSPKVTYSILLSLSLAGVFYTHILTFLIASIASFVLFAALVIKNKKILSFNKVSIKSLIFYTLASVICFGIIAITFLPQLEWQKQTTRDYLIQDRDVYPKWQSTKELIGSIFVGNLNTEKIVTIGTVPSILALIGFVKLKNKHKTIFTLIALPIVLISLNNSSPIHDLLISQDWYVMLRVATRVWVILVFVVLFLIGIAIEKSNRKVVIALAIVGIIETLFLGYQVILKPIIPNDNLAPKEIYEFLSEDKTNFRVFCTNRCLSQKQSAIYNLHLADGYGTLQQKNYYEAAKQIGQYYSNRYSLSIPPFEIYLYNNLQPHTPTLAQYNIKYVVSKHELTDKNLNLINKYQEYYLYTNKMWQDPNYEILTPNLIRINTIDKQEVTIPEIYSNGWRAYANGNEEIKVEEESNSTIKIKLPENTSYVNLEYRPKSYETGKIITTTTTVLIIATLLYSYATSKKK